jgi:hypothetical protein
LGKNGIKKTNPLTVTFHIGGKQVDKLTTEQCERMAQKFSEVTSTYYTSHLEEFLKIKEESNCTVIT